MKTLLIIFTAMSLSTVIYAQDKEMPLWPNGAPGALGKKMRDIPTITPFPSAAKNNSGSAIVICPGGGYGGLASHEGSTYAQFLQQHGINAFVLKYRLGSAGYRHPIMLGDAARAIRTVRTNAKKWNIDPEKIGIMGSSAGGHLASTMITHFDKGNPNASDPVDRASSRPNVGILCYPVITMGEFTHQGSKRNLLGKNPSKELTDLLSSEKQVRKDTPPTFVWHTAEDRPVPVENSMLFASALRKAAVPFALHIYQKGRHGIGLADKPPFKNVHPWANDLVFWLKEQGFIAK
ncbi:MAG TPA: endo-1,4-beta-xylanase [Verrucomicrobiales bacterium]|jgi:acetyl esterase/lipase|nr:endo-1,4-beta-xylanase [Verrucomicrobiales bacterium]HAH98332.1 endo-1,4-beta-xylanase [Verrucomicrobiales bacterium]|tara:strand:+ start:1883 stop:2758 length:876 start_codon:yes stop_codon:yes gene_type:complete